MSHKQKGQITVSGEWAKHLHGRLRKPAFWKTERQAEKSVIKKEENKISTKTNN